MEELRPEDLEELVQELEDERGAEESLSPEVEELLQDLQADRRLTRKEAAQQLGELNVSSLQVVQALIAARDSDRNYQIRLAAAEALRALPHQALLQQHPELIESATSDVGPTRWARDSRAVTGGRLVRGPESILMAIVGAIVGMIVGAILFVVVGALLLEWSGIGNLPCTLAFGVIGGAIAGATVGLEEREWQFMKLFEDGGSWGGIDEGGCLLLLGLAVIVAFAEAFWVLGLRVKRLIVRAIRRKDGASADDVGPVRGAEAADRERGVTEEKLPSKEIW